MHLFEEFARRAGKGDENVADELRKKRSVRSRKGENL
jgi:hypothetical protein